MIRAAAGNLAPSIRHGAAVFAIAFAFVLAAPSNARTQQPEGRGASRTSFGLARAIERLFSPITRKTVTPVGRAKTARTGPKSIQPGSPRAGNRRSRRPRKPPPLVVPDRTRGEIIVSFAAGTPDAVINRYMRQHGLTRLADSTNALLGQRIVRARSAANRPLGGAFPFPKGPPAPVQPNQPYVGQDDEGVN